MQLFINKNLAYKLLSGNKKGILIGQKLFDIFYVQDTIPYSINKIIKHYPAILPSIIGEYICYEKQPKNIIKKNLFSKNDIQFIKLLIFKNNHSKKISRRLKILNKAVTFKAFLRTINHNKKNPIIENINVIIV
jgi:hypothetical protein